MQPKKRSMVLGKITDSYAQMEPLPPRAFTSRFVCGRRRWGITGGFTAGFRTIIGKMDLRAPGWSCRMSIGAAAPRTPCLSRVSAFEKQLGAFTNNPTDKVIVAMLGTCFDPLGEAYAFYNLYSWEKGFGIRHGKSMLNVERTKCMQDHMSSNTDVCFWLCRCECESL